jgi:hypothetical protein
MISLYIFVHFSCRYPNFMFRIFHISRGHISSSSHNQEANDWIKRQSSGKLENVAGSFYACLEKNIFLVTKILTSDQHGVHLGHWMKVIFHVLHFTVVVQSGLKTSESIILTNSNNGSELVGTKFFQRYYNPL